MIRAIIETARETVEDRTSLRISVAFIVVLTLGVNVPWALGWGQGRPVSKTTACVPRLVTMVGAIPLFEYDCKK